MYYCLRGMLSCQTGFLFQAELPRSCPGRASAIGSAAHQDSSSTAASRKKNWERAEVLWRQPIRQCPDIRRGVGG